MKNTAPIRQAMRNEAYAAGPHFPCFARASQYRDLTQSTAACVHESDRRRPAFPYSERHLHCVWHDPGLRPPVLTTRRGESVAVEHSGLWNHEAGPDFIGAVLLIGESRRRVFGDVEIHIHPQDWKAHGHAQDPRFGDVRFHVTYFPGDDASLNTVPNAEQIVLKDALAALPGFAFEQIDTTAYPYGARADIPPCSTVLALYQPDEREQLLQAAGEERLRRKAEQIQRSVQEFGVDQVLYEEILTALGYKHNKRACRHLARLLSHATLRELADGDPMRGYALLLGMAGLLPDPSSTAWPPETQSWLRQLWQIWWRHEQALPSAMNESAWRLDSLRPTNHPVRRLCGAAHLFCAAEPLIRKVERCWADDPARWTASWLEYCTSRADPFWSTRLTLRGEQQAKPIALIGKARATAIVVNVLLPLAAGHAKYSANVLTALDHLPQEAENALVKQTAYYLFGRDHSPSLYRDTLARQGLLQIFHDFCMSDRSRCASCTFPQTLQRHLEQR